MKMTDFQDTVIKVSVRTFWFVIVGIVAGVSSFWVGYGNLMSKLESMDRKNEIKHIQQDNEINKLKEQRLAKYP